jgi:hypothetical protein
VQILLVLLQFSSKLLKLFEELGMIEIGLRGAERGHPFFRPHILAKKVCSQKLTKKRKKKKICQIFHQKKIQKVVMKIEEMADVFLNLANFVSHTILTLAPPSGYALNLKGGRSKAFLLSFFLLHF